MEVKIAITAKVVVAIEKNRQAANAVTLAEMSSPAHGLRLRVAVVTIAIRATVQRKKAARLVGRRLDAKRGHEINAELFRSFRWQLSHRRFSRLF